ncbi:MAG: hypothetical protein CM15mP59_4400 [Flavobacteriaceae bacterium]|nr:MAG: hypothetical protein CM15mP59_4400 [Flavobacteriaceae bacterium]
MLGMTLVRRSYNHFAGDVFAENKIGLRIDLSSFDPQIIYAENPAVVIQTNAESAQTSKIKASSFSKSVKSTNQILSKFNWEVIAFIFISPPIENIG